MIALEVRGDVVEVSVREPLTPDSFRAYLAACASVSARFERSPPRYVVSKASFSALHGALAASGLRVSLSSEVPSVQAAEGRGRPLAAALAPRPGLLVCSECGAEWSGRDSDGRVVCAAGHAEDLSRVAGQPLVVRPYQNEGIAWLRQPEHNCALLADSPGVGKTIQGLRAVVRGTPVIVVCPASVKTVWRDEAAKFRPDLKVVVFYGRTRWLCEEHAEGRQRVPKRRGVFRASPARDGDDGEDDLDEAEPEARREGDAERKCQECRGRGKKLAVGNYFVFRPPEPDEVVILNPQIFPKAWKGLRPKTRLLADEAHVYAYHDSNQTRRVRSLVHQLLKVGGGAWAFTGTPLWHKPPTLWCLLTTFQINPWSDFDEEFVPDFGGERNKHGALDWAEKPPADVQAKLRPVMLRRLKRDVLKDLPPLTIQDVEVTVDAKARTAGDRVLAQLELMGLPIEVLLQAEEKADFVAQALDPEARKRLPPEQWREARHRLIALLAEAREALVKAKLPAILEFIENEYEPSGEQVVVFSAHRVVPETLAQREGWASILGGMGKQAVDRVLDRFVTGEVRGVAATIRTIGLGINKLVCCSHALMADWEYAPGWNDQAIERLWRLGQKNPVLVRRFVADHPLEQRVLKALTESANRINNVVGGGVF